MGNAADDPKLTSDIDSILKPNDPRDPMFEAPGEFPEEAEYEEGAEYESEEEQDAEGAPAAAEGREEAKGEERRSAFHLPQARTNSARILGSTSWSIKSIKCCFCCSSFSLERLIATFCSKQRSSNQSNGIEQEGQSEWHDRLTETKFQQHRLS